MIPGLAPIRWLVVYFGGAFIGAVMVANTVKYSTRTFLTSKFRGTRKTRSSLPRGRR